MLARERLELCRLGKTDLATPSTSSDAYTRERLQQIETQLPRLLHRHHLVYQALLILYTAVLCFVACMFLVAFAALLNSRTLATVVLFFFLASIAVLLAALVPIVREIHVSQQAVHYEVNRVLSLGK